MMRNDTNNELYRINIGAKEVFVFQVTKMSADLIGPGLRFVAQVRL